MANGTSIRPTNLLLLPSPPRPGSFASIKAAYQPALTATLKQLALEIGRATNGAILDIVLPISQVQRDSDIPRADLYVPVQGFVAGVYKLLCMIAAEEDINVEDHEGIDARILLISSPYAEDIDSAQPISNPPDFFGPVIDLQTLAQCHRPWKYVFAVDGEEGEKLLKNFLVIRDTHMTVRKVPGGLVMTAADAPSITPMAASAHGVRRHHSVILGGTFDHLHIGHKLLLTMFAFVLQQSSRIENLERCYTIGITNDAMLKGKKYAEMVEVWRDRQRSTATFMNAILDFRLPQDAIEEIEELNLPGPNGHAIHVKLGPSIVLKYVAIQDPFGPTITVEDISAIVISAETRSGGQDVNKKRAEKGWAELDVFEVDVLDSEDPDDKNLNPQNSDSDAFQNKLSSTKIRQALSEKGEKRRKT